MASTAQSKTFYGLEEKLMVVEEGRQTSSGQHRINLEVAAGWEVAVGGLREQTLPD